MPARRTRRIEDTLEALGALLHGALDARAIAQLRDGLGSRQSVVVAKAAAVAGAREVAGLAGDLLAAFERFLLDPGRTDPGCLAKQAIAGALDTLGHQDGAVFLHGIRHVQPEPVWGGSRDTAGDLRVTCALALVRLEHPSLAAELAELLADPEAPVRAGAARAMAATGDGRLGPVLRLKILLGDAEPQVTAECLTALLRLEPESGMPFVERLLASAGEPVREAAVLALGESRLRAALPVLRRWWEATPSPGLRRTALLAIAMLRHDDALAFLLHLVAEGIGPDARDALAALRIHRHDPALRTRVLAAAARDDLDLRPALAAFANPDDP